MIGEGRRLADVAGRSERGADDVRHVSMGCSAAWAGWAEAGSRAPGSAGPLSDREELSASQFGVNEEAERIGQLALLHQPDQNRLPELG